MKPLKSEDYGLVSIVVPVYNEEDHVENSLKTMAKRLEGLGIRFELLVVESGSTDDSRKIIEKLSGLDKRIKLIHQEKREGMGSAIAFGFQEAKGDYYFWIDSDLPYDLSYLKEGLKVLENADVVAGYRICKGRPFKRKLYTAVFNFIINALYSPKIKDLNFAYKLFTKKVFDRIEITSKSSFFAAEILIKCKRLGFKIDQMAIPYDARKTGESKLGNLKTVVYVLKDMVRFIIAGK